MSLQSTTLSRYRQIFPQETLRETSARTGIQITRVFRLFGGKPMKVGELEAFDRAIKEKMAENPHTHKFRNLLDEGLAILTSEELAKLNDYLERKILNKTYGRIYMGASHNEAIIA